MIQDISKVKQFAEKIFKDLQPECTAIYLGGSSVDPFINNTKDYDFILFIGGATASGEVGELGINKFQLYQKLKLVKKQNPDIPIVISVYYKDELVHGTYDLIQIRSNRLINTCNTRITYWSYLDHYMIKLVGDDAELNDILVQRAEYLKVAECAIEKLKALKSFFKINPKRWYQVYIGLCILEKNSYELTEEQIANANILHDMKEETLEIRLKLQQEIEEKLKKLK